MSDESAIFSSIEIDTIGEIMNISMGSAATAASTLLDNKVTITTPIVNLVSVADFEIAEFAPAIAVDIRYVEGISGSNILILRKDDVRTILGQMMMTELSEDFEIDEMAESAICELMNQMMGSSATVLSCFLGRTINISTPSTVPIDQLDEFKQNNFEGQSSLITIEFTITIKDIMESQFVSVLNIDLAKEIIDVSLNFDSGGDEAAAEAPAPAPAPPPPPMPQAPTAAPAPQAAPAATAPPPPPPQQPAYAPPPADYGQDPAAQQYGYPPPGYAPQPGYQQPPPGYGYPPPPGYGYPPMYQQPSPITVKEYDYGDFGQGAALPESVANIDLVMDVPVVVSVELGRTRRKIKEILEFGQGTIVELDKQAGSQVDVIVNGQLIAKGDVVVVDDNFSIRVTEILKNRESLTLL